MSFIILKNPNQQNRFNQLQGYRNGNNMIKFRQDINGDWFINESIKNAPQFNEVRNLWTGLPVVESVTVLEYDDVTGEEVERILT